jgi:hypothetical protein
VRHQLARELDLDEILMRAETTETTEPASAHSAFLAQFNVADVVTANLASNWDTYASACACAALECFSDP